MLTLRPPGESIDDAREWISPSDPAWNGARTRAEQKHLGDLAVLEIDASADLTDAELETLKAKARHAAEMTHPVAVWYEGGSKFSHDATITVPDALRTDEHPAAAVAIGEYLSGVPTIFELKSLGIRDHRAAMAISISDPEERWHVSMVRRGLVRIKMGDAAGTVLDAPRGDDGLVEWGWIDWLSKYDRELINPLAWGVYKVSQGTGERGKR
jgi:hypothetical protein